MKGQKKKCACSYSFTHRFLPRCSWWRGPAGGGGRPHSGQSPVSVVGWLSWPTVRNLGRQLLTDLFFVRQLATHVATIYALALFPGLLHLQLLIAAIKNWRCRCRRRRNEAIYALLSGAKGC